MKTIFSLIFFCLISSAFGEDRPIQFIYLIDWQEDELLHMIPYLKDGKILGHFQIKGEVKKEELNLNNLGKFFSGFYEKAQDIEKRYKEQVEKDAKSIREEDKYIFRYDSNLNNARAPGPQAPAPDLSSENSSPALASVPQTEITSSYNEDAFKQCAVNALPLLKKSLFYQSVSQPLLRENVEIQISATKANTDGLTCNKFLNDVVHTPVPLVEQIKFLTVASAKSGEDLKNFIRAFAVVFSWQTSSTKLPWAYIYKKSCLQSMKDTSSLIKDFSAMYQEFEDKLENQEVILPDTFNFKFKTTAKIKHEWDKNELKKAFKEGLKYAKTIEFN